MVNAIMALPDIEQRDLSSVRVVINGGEKMPIPLIERIQRTFPSAWFADAYGLTETVSGDTFLDRDSIVTKLGSVGRPCLYLELDIWDEDGQVGARRGARGDRHARPEGLQGLLAGSRRHRRRLRRGLVPHRGHRRPRRRRLPLHRRSAQGHDRVGRGEHRQLGGRARALRARCGARGGRGRPSGRSMGRGPGGLRRPAPGRDTRRRTRSSSTAAPSWRASRSPRRSRSSTRCPATRRGRSSSASSATGSERTVRSPWRRGRSRVVSLLPGITTRVPSWRGVKPRSRTRPGLIRDHAQRRSASRRDGCRAPGATPTCAAGALRRRP